MGLDEAQTGLKTPSRNMNKLRYAYDTTLMAECEEEVNSLLMKVKEESEKYGLQLNIQKTKIMESGLITSWQIDATNVETVSDLIFLDSKINVDGDCSHEIRRHLFWQESHDRHRPCVEKQRHNSADKGPYSQGNGLPSGHICL